MAEEARLESVYTPKGYHEFESRSLRKRSEVRRIAPGFFRRRAIRNSLLLRGMEHRSQVTPNGYVTTFVTKNKF